MKSFINFLLIVLFFSTNAFSDDFSEAMLKAKKNLKSATNKFDEKSLLKVRGEFERILQLKKHQWLIHYYLAYIDYNLAMTGMRGEERDMGKIKKYNLSGFEQLNKSIDMRDDFADSYVLKIALNFNRWIYEQDKMNDIMSETEQAEKQALKLDSLNPRFYLMKGMSSYYTPEMFGGGAPKAVIELEKSCKIFETRKEIEDFYPDWGRDFSYGLLVMAYLKRNNDGDIDKAGEYFQKGLELEPESGFLNSTVKKMFQEKSKEK